MTKVSVEHHPKLGKTSVAIGIYLPKTTSNPKRRKFGEGDRVMLKWTRQVGTIVSQDTYRTTQVELEPHWRDCEDVFVVLKRAALNAMYSGVTKWKSRCYYTVALLNGDVINCIPVCDLKRRVE